MSCLIIFGDPHCGFKVSDMEEALEIPIMNDLTMVLGSISQVTINDLKLNVMHWSYLFSAIKFICYDLQVQNILMDDE